MTHIADIITNTTYGNAYEAMRGRRQPKCRLIPPGARLIRITH
jgi:hypothetical protein